MTTTKERPILFSGPMVKAIMAGRKTQTRRVAKRPSGGLSTVAKFCLKGSACPDLYAWVDGHPDDIETWGVVGAPMRCPYGQPGDRLWVRETWAARLDENDKPDPNPHYVKYRADHDKASPYDPMDWHRWPDHWSSPRFMPRWASRLTLEVTAVRVERLNAISHEDAIAEGCEGCDWVASSPYIVGPHTDAGELPCEEFARLWDSINGKRHPWTSNPWVWVVEFKPVDPS